MRASQILFSEKQRIYLHALKKKEITRIIYVSGKPYTSKITHQTSCLCNVFRRTTSTVCRIVISPSISEENHSPYQLKCGNVKKLNILQQLQNENKNYKHEACQVTTCTTDVPSSSFVLALISAKRGIGIFNCVSNVLFKLTIRILRDIRTVYRRAKIPEEKKKRQKYQMKKEVK